MNRKFNFLGLPDLGLNLILGGLSCFVSLLGCKLLFASWISLQWSDARIVTSDSAIKLEVLRQRLDEQATIIQQKDEAYELLEQTYNDALVRGAGYTELGEVIEAIDDLPEIKDTSGIQHELQEIETNLLDIPDS